MLVNYEQLPEAAWTEIVRFFRIDVSETELEAFQRVAMRNAKNPELEFEMIQVQSAKTLLTLCEKHPRGGAIRFLNPSKSRDWATPNRSSASYLRS